MTQNAEIQAKERRLFGLLERLGYDSLIVARRDNIAWLTGGGEAVSDRESPYSPVYLVLSPGRKAAVGYFMDLPRTLDEALAGLGYEGVSLPTFGKTPEEAARELAGGRAAADAPFLGVDDIDEHIPALYLPYTPEEVARYQAVAGECAGLLTELAGWVQPGMTERQVFARMWGLCLESGFAGRFMFVGADERIEKYRHPVPSDKPIERVVLFAPTAIKYGLASLLTRMVSFGEPDRELRRRYQAVATMQAAMIQATRPGVRLADLRQRIFDLYDELGFADEKYRHFHGGPVGYRGSFIGPMADPEAVVQVNSTFTYYLTVTGAKSEEVLLVEPDATRIITTHSSWPTLSVDYGGTTIQVPDILVR
jgi:Xaa-Pro dipeptidase